MAGGRANNRRGKAAEGRIAKALSALTGLRFARTPGSGSQHAAAFFACEQVRGDVVCRDTKFVFPFMLESKKSKDFVWDLLFTGKPCSDFVDWWEKAKKDADLDGKYPMLVVSRNQGPMVVFVEASAWEKLRYDPKYVNGRIRYRGKWLNVTVIDQLAKAFNASNGIMVMGHKKKGKK